MANDVGLLLRRAVAGRTKSALLIPAAVGAGVGAANAPEGRGWSGAARGAGIGATTGLGSGIGGLLGTGLGGLAGAGLGALGQGMGADSGPDSRIGQALMLAGLLGGGATGAMAGGVGGYAGGKKMLWFDKDQYKAKKPKPTADENVKEAAGFGGLGAARGTGTGGGAGPTMGTSGAAAPRLDAGTGILSRIATDPKFRDSLQQVRQQLSQPRTNAMQRSFTRGLGTGGAWGTPSIQQQLTASPPLGSTPPTGSPVKTAAGLGGLLGKLVGGAGKAVGKTPNVINSTARTISRTPVGASPSGLSPGNPLNSISPEGRKAVGDAMASGMSRFDMNAAGTAGQAYRGNAAGSAAMDAAWADPSRALTRFTGAAKAGPTGYSLPNRGPKGMGWKAKAGLGAAGLGLAGAGYAASGGGKSPAGTPPGMSATSGNPTTAAQPAGPAAVATPQIPGANEPSPAETAWRQAHPGANPEAPGAPPLTDKGVAGATAKPGLGETFSGWGKQLGDFASQIPEHLSNGWKALSSHMGEHWPKWLAGGAGVLGIHHLIKQLFGNRDREREGAGSLYKMSADNTLVRQLSEAFPCEMGFLKCCADRGWSEQQVIQGVLKSASLDPAIEVGWQRFCATWPQGTAR